MLPSVWPRPEQEGQDRSLQEVLLRHRSLLDSQSRQASLTLFAAHQLQGASRSGVENLIPFQPVKDCQFVDREGGIGSEHSGTSL